MELTELINKEILSPDDILSIIAIVGKRKDVILVKNDGIRNDKQYTVVIIPSQHPEKSIRCDSDFLDEAIRSVIKEYITLK